MCVSLATCHVCGLVGRAVCVCVCVSLTGDLPSVRSCRQGVSPTGDLPSVRSCRQGCVCVSGQYSSLN